MLPITRSTALAPVLRAAAHARSRLQSLSTRTHTRTPARLPHAVGAVTAGMATKSSSGGAPTLGRAAALAAALRQIESTFGKGAIMQLGAKGNTPNVEVIPTGSLALDLALGVGGLPLGRVVEIYGAESSGKTTLALHAIAEAQRAGKNCCFIDAEHALDPTYARGVGVNLDALYLAQPDTGEQALEIADTLVRSGGVDVLVIDSVAALVPRAEIEGEMGDHHMALQARLMSQALRKLTASLAKSKTLIIFINQIRHKVGVMFGSPEVTTGGNALKFYSSIRLEIRRTGQIKNGETITGNTVRVKVAKNKFAPPFRTADFEMTYGTGINRASEAVDLAVTFGLMRKSGAWYAITNQTLLDAVNGKGTVAAPAPAPAETAAPAPAPPAEPAGKRKKRAAAPAPAPAAAAPPTTPAAAEAPAAAAAVASPIAVLNEPFLQGKEKVKVFFETHPAVLDTCVKLVRAAMKERPAPAPGPVTKPAAADDALPAAPGATEADPFTEDADEDLDELSEPPLAAPHLSPARPLGA